MRLIDAPHALPLPVTWTLMGRLRKAGDSETADRLFSIFDDAVVRTLLHVHLGPDPPPARGAPPVRARIESAIRRSARLRREWIDCARAGLGPERIAGLRADALQTVRNLACALPERSGTRSDLTAALDDVARASERFEAALRAGVLVDLRRMRVQSTRFDWCVTASLFAEIDACFAGLVPGVPLFCAEARIAAARLVRIADPHHRVGGRARTKDGPRRSRVSSSGRARRAAAEAGVAAEAAPP